MKQASAMAFICLLLLICSAALATDIPKSIGFQLPATWDEAIHADSLKIIDITDTTDIVDLEIHGKQVRYMPSALGTQLTCIYYADTDKLKYGRCLFFLDHAFYYSSGYSMITCDYDVKGILIQYQIIENPAQSSSDGSTSVILTFSADGNLSAITVYYGVVDEYKAFEYNLNCHSNIWTCTDPEKPTDAKSLPFDADKLREAANRHNAEIHMIQTPAHVTAVPATATPTPTDTWHIVTPTPVDSWTCFNCGTPQSDHSMHCANCGAQKNCWCCQYCNTWNSDTICTHCGLTLKESLEMLLESYQKDPAGHTEQIDAIRLLLENDESSHFELPSDKWICLNCDALQSLSDRNCRLCGTQQHTWSCQVCNTWNSELVCGYCQKTLEDTLMIRLKSYQENPEKYKDKIQAIEYVLEYVLDTMFQS